MSGIYIHIPYCKQACNYCDFHFSVSLKNKKELISSIKNEIRLQKNYLGGTTINTIYFGGGTPSLLSNDELQDIFYEISTNFSVDSNSEITLEANPDDLKVEKLKALIKTPINRLSIGIQSFFEDDLKFMNRSHSVKSAIASVKDAQQIGFKNLTIDLIYGTPTLTDDQWKYNIDTAMTLNIPHLSCYSLTIEQNTPLAFLIKQGKALPVDQEKSARQFKMVMRELTLNNYLHYEISNFGKVNFLSRHNSNYWKGKKYLGIGPSAHSFNGDTRQWNVKSNSAYIKSINENRLPNTLEVLTPSMKYNEYVLTSLRTMWGIDKDKLRDDFTPFFSHFEKESKKYFKEELLIQKKEIILLTERGKFFADSIASDLFSV